MGGVVGCEEPSRDGGRGMPLMTDLALGRVSVALTKVDPAGGGRGYARPRQALERARTFSNLQPERWGERTQKEKLKWYFGATESPNLPVPFFAPAPRFPPSHNTCEYLPWAMFPALPHRVWRRGFSPRTFTESRRILGK